MSWNYGGDPSLNPRDGVRFEIGDTTPGKTPTLTDEEIEYLLRENSPKLAAAKAARALGARYSGMSATSKSVGDLSLSFEYGAVAERFEAMAARLEKGSYGAFVPIVSDATLAAGVFSIGMDDNTEDWTGA